MIIPTEPIGRIPRPLKLIDAADFRCTWPNVEATELIAMVASLAGRTQEARTTDTKVTTAR